MLFSAVISASLEVVGIALLYPLIAVAMNPSFVVQNEYVSIVYNFFGFSEPRHFVVLIAICVGMSFIAKNMYMLLQQKFQFDMVRDWRIDICNRLMEEYVNAPLTYHLSKSSASIINNLTAVVSRVVNSYLIQCIMFVSNSIVCVSLLIILMIKYSVISLVSGGVVGILLWSQMRVIRRVAKDVNDKYVIASQENISILSSSLAGIKDTKLTGKESVFLKKYHNSNYKVSEIDKTNMLIQYIPVYLSEAILMFGIVIFISYILLTSPNPADGIVSITLLSAIAIRLAPMLNRLLYCYSQIKSSSNAVETIINEFNSLNGVNDSAKNRLEFGREIKMANVCFSYKGKKNVGINNVNITINQGEFVGIVGASGAGKTTFADLLAGLLPIESGKIYVDGIEVNYTDYKGIRNNVSYVSQSPFILTGSIRENVAFGAASEDIDDKEVINVLEMAGLYDLVCERGLNYHLGENGKNVSGGQRQRIIIARALYLNREIILFDEATSALDTKTEFDITNVIAGLKGQRTIVMVAHRLSTLAKADKLIVFDNGTITGVGSFDELINENQKFKTLVELSRCSIK
ncbi:Protein glycosylation K [Vibrio stylophorae]|uniref:Protein glycosylation K n=1 Tax=Vibrio stylophorae TaxID=659351 RepID=A0ABN8DV99_9VIBR|nr:Protein glycosylation K [Vibrio stylophorae]